VLALAIVQVGSTDGPKIRAALEDLRTPFGGAVKIYDHPFSPNDDVKDRAVVVTQDCSSRYIGGLSAVSPLDTNVVIGPPTPKSLGPAWCLVLSPYTEIILTKSLRVANIAHPLEVVALGCMRCLSRGEE
jgi:hypothetical protein